MSAEPATPAAPAAPAAAAAPAALVAPAAPVATSTPVAAMESAAPSGRAPAPVLGPKFTDAYIDRINRNFRGIGIGFDQGLWGRGFGQTLKLTIPFGKRVGQFFGMRLRGMSVFDPSNVGVDSLFGGGIELFGRSPVYLGLLRVYGGGGVWAGGRPFKPASDATRGWGVGGGGHFGIEFVLAPRMGMTFEVGGRSSIHALGLDAGATATAGVVFYLGNLRGRG